MPFFFGGGGVKASRTTYLETGGTRKAFTPASRGSDSVRNQGMSEPIPRGSGPVTQGLRFVVGTFSIPRQPIRVTYSDLKWAFPRRKSSENSLWHNSLWGKGTISEIRKPKRNIQTEDTVSGENGYFRGGFRKLNIQIRKIRKKAFDSRLGRIYDSVSFYSSIIVWRKERKSMELGHWIFDA